MALDPIELALASKAGREIAQASIKTLLKKVQRIERGMGNGFQVLNKEIIIQCPEQIHKISMPFRVKSGLFKNRKERFRYGDVRRVSIRSLETSENYTDAISRRPDKGFDINLRKLSKISETDIFILDVEYNINDSRFVESFVDRRKLRETSSEKRNRYWLHAALKHPSVLKDRGYRVDLRDVDFSVDVGVHQDVKMKIPSIFNQELETIVKMIRETDTHKKVQYARQHAQQRGRGYTGKEVDILNDLQGLFSSHNFQKFISVEDDFEYNDCYRGSDFYDSMPFPTWPKYMKVIARTDLDTDKPASYGQLIYNKHNFQDKIAAFFPKEKKRGRKSIAQKIRASER